MKPEEQAEIILWDWFKTKSKNIEEVYFNRKNKIKAPIFKTEGINKKPDLILKINDGYKIQYYAIEVKSSNNSKNILQASKILDKYLLHYSKVKLLISLKIKK